MATPASISSLEPILKTVYDKQAKVIAFDMHPFLGRVPKNEKFFGENFVQTVRFVGGQGVSADFTEAQTNRTANAYRKFTITRWSDYAVGSITGEAIEAAQGDMYTMAEGLESEIKGLFTSIGISAAAAAYRSGSGTIAKGVTLLTLTDLLLAQPSDAIHFGVGMSVSSSPTDGTGLQNIGKAVVTALDMESGIVSAAGGWAASIGGFAATDYLFAAGNYNAKMPGLLKWIPPTSPTAGDNLYGVDRSVAPVELAGQRIAGNGKPREETLQKALALCSRFGAKITDFYMHPEDLSRCAISIGSQVRRVDAQAYGTASIGYRAIEVEGPTGTVKVFGDPDCPQGYGFGLKLDTWELRSLKAMPRFLDLDGNRILREATADSYEFRIGYRAALRCDSPKDNIVVTWLSAMAYQTRWPVDSTTNELVHVPLDFQADGIGGFVEKLPSGVSGGMVTSVVNTGVGLYTVNLDQSWPFFLGHDLHVEQTAGDTSAWIVTVYQDSVVNAEPATLLIQLYKVGTGLADPQAGNLLRGLLHFRNREEGMLHGPHDRDSPQGEGGGVRRGRGRRGRAFRRGNGRCWRRAQGGPEGRRWSADRQGGMQHLRAVRRRVVTTRREVSHAGPCLS